MDLRRFKSEKVNRYISLNDQDKEPDCLQTPVKKSLFFRSRSFLREEDEDDDDQTEKESFKSQKESQQSEKPEIEATFDVQKYKKFMGPFFVSTIKKTCKKHLNSQTKKNKFNSATSKSAWELTTNTVKPILSNATKLEESFNSSPKPKRSPISQIIKKNFPYPVITLKDHLLTPIWIPKETSKHFRIDCEHKKFPMKLYLSDRKVIATIYISFNMMPTKQSYHTISYQVRSSFFLEPPNLKILSNLKSFYRDSLLYIGLLVEGVTDIGCSIGCAFKGDTKYCNQIDLKKSPREESESLYESQQFRGRAPVKWTDRDYLEYQHFQEFYKPKKVKLFQKKNSLQQDSISFGYQTSPNTSEAPNSPGGMSFSPRSSVPETKTNILADNMVLARNYANYRQFSNKLQALKYDFRKEKVQENKKIVILEKGANRETISDRNYRWRMAV